MATVRFQGKLSEQSSVGELWSVGRILEDVDSAEEVQRPTVIAATHDFACLLELLDRSCLQAFSGALQLS